MILMPADLRLEYVVSRDSQQMDEATPKRRETNNNAAKKSTILRKERFGTLHPVEVDGCCCSSSCGCLKAAAAISRRTFPAWIININEINVVHESDVLSVHTLHGH